MKIIIVDDERDTVESLQKIMELENIEVAGVGYDGENAFQLYKKHNPDVVLLDMKMPEFDGAYAIKKIKEFDSNAKIIVITGYTDYDFQRDDAAAIFTKPYDVDKVITAVRKAAKSKDVLVN